VPKRTVAIVDAICRDVNKGRRYFGELASSGEKRSHSPIVLRVLPLTLSSHESVASQRRKKNAIVKRSPPFCTRLFETHMYKLVDLLLMSTYRYNKDTIHFDTIISKYHVRSLRTHPRTVPPLGFREKFFAVVLAADLKGKGLLGW
jgi:hypothetical protein